MDPRSGAVPGHPAIPRAALLPAQLAVVRRAKARARVDELLAR